MTLKMRVFPFTYQLNDPATRIPQEILSEHASKFGVDVIDFTPIFAAAVYQEPEVEA